MQSPPRADCAMAATAGASCVVRAGHTVGRLPAVIPQRHETVHPTDNVFADDMWQQPKEGTHEARHPKANDEEGMRPARPLACYPDCSHDFRPDLTPSLLFQHCRAALEHRRLRWLPILCQDSSRGHPGSQHHPVDCLVVHLYLHKANWRSCVPTVQSSPSGARRRQNTINPRTDHMRSIHLHFTHIINVR